MRKLKKYSTDTIRAEALLILSNKTYTYVSRELGIPLSTVGWHMLHALKDIDPFLYKQVRQIIKQHQGARH